MCWKPRQHPACADVSLGPHRSVQGQRVSAPAYLLQRKPSAERSETLRAKISISLWARSSRRSAGSTRLAFRFLRIGQLLIILICGEWSLHKGQEDKGTDRREEQ